MMHCKLGINTKARRALVSSVSSSDSIRRIRIKRYSKLCFDIQQMIQSLRKMTAWRFGLS